MQVASETAKIYIDSLIEGIPDIQIEDYFGENYEDDGEFGFEDEDEEISDEISNMSSWLNKISQRAETAIKLHKDDGNRDNSMECQPFAKYFVKLCEMIPIWSGISRKFFDSPNLVGSSWSSETYFKNMKQLHGDKIPCSVDEFVKRDLEFNESTVIGASKKYLTQISQKPKAEKSKSKQKKKPVESVSTQHAESSTAQLNTKQQVDLMSDAQSAEHNTEQLNIQPQIELMSDDSTENIGPLNAHTCCLCADGYNDSGAFNCFSCNKRIHLIEGCSVTIGEKWQCVSCHEKELSTSKTSNAEEEKSKRTQSNKSLDAITKFKQVLEKTEQDVDLTPNVASQIGTTCIACANGKRGNYKCNSCDRSVHLLRECSVPIQEGKRQCISCKQSAERKEIDHSETAKALNSEEKWTRNASSKASKYLQSVPNWGLVPINKIVPAIIE